MGYPVEHASDEGLLLEENEALRDAVASLQCASYWPCIKPTGLVEQTICPSGVDEAWSGLHFHDALDCSSDPIAEKTAAVIKACKDRSISVTSALHAACIQTITKYADPTANVSRYVTVNSLSLRPYLPKPYNTSGYAVSVYYAALPFILDTPASFSEAAAALHKHYQIGFKNNIANREIYGYMACMLRDMVQAREFQAKPISKGCAVTVKDFMSGAGTVLGMSMLFIYTFHDRLRLVYSFNDGFEEESNIHMYLEEIDRVLPVELLGQMRDHRRQVGLSYT
ncbi:hypothetical protein BDV39DRAFT_199782 [Aspergillus sergii]|uniref:Uncharacterized protein n=1 Tax=Aspergillus sergii TaxID=1034303 RepID=A0A5N6XHS8_9EURO|nr:hypothetical protein BDV39DRAFT_199782 [Aspergillus sergii]